jgi:hemoglobin/transferrin/lactoferrin receptor protein
MNFSSPALILFLFTMSIPIEGQGFSKDSLKTVTLNDVVVSANKIEETRRTIAQQIQVIYSSQISSLQSQSTADLLSNTGLVYVQKSQLGGGSVTIRGFEASRTLLVVDGMRMNNLIYRAGHLQNIVTFDNNALSKVEILYGPSSTIYGSDALGGAVVLYTKKPVFASDINNSNFKVNAFSRYGSADNELTGHLDFNVGVNNIASLTSVTYSAFGDLNGGRNKNMFYSDPYGERISYAARYNNRDSTVINNKTYLQVQSGYNQYDFGQKFAFKQNNFTTHLLNFQFSNSSDVPRYDRLTERSGTLMKYAQWYYGPQKRVLGAYDLSIANPDSWFRNIHAIVSYQNVVESRHSRKFNNNNLQHRIEDVDVFGANIDLQRVSGRNNIRFGIDVQYNTLKSKADNENISTGIHTPLDTRYPDGDNTMTNVAAYISHTFQINDKLVVTDGFRLGHITLHSTFVNTTFFPLPFRSANQNNPVYSGNLGIINTPSDNLKLSFLVSTGFRAPNVDDLSKVFESAPGQLIVPNSDLKPEKTINYELSITKLFNSRISWENVAYFTNFYDAIVTDKFTYNGSDSIVYNGTKSKVLANQNKKRAFIYGFSTSIRSELTKNIFLTYGLNYTYGRINENGTLSPLDHIPPLVMRMQISYATNNFNSEFFVNYNGWKRIKDYYLNGEDNEQYATPDGMPAWMTLNLRLSYKVHKLLALETGIDNILDTQYRTFSSGINGPGRNIFFSLRFSL